MICVADVSRSRYRVLGYQSTSCKLGLTHPTIERNSDCLFKASTRILLSTFLTSVTGRRLNTSSGSIPAQSVSLSASPFGVPSRRVRRKRRNVGVEVPELDAVTDTFRSVAPPGRRTMSLRGAFVRDPR